MSVQQVSLHRTFDDIHSVYSNIDTFCANVYKVDSQGHSLDTSCIFPSIAKLTI